MSKHATTLDSKSKNLTNAERQAMSDAEAAYLPNRSDKLKIPAFVGKDEADARAYWRKIIKRMEGYAILDVLDAEMLGVYCQMLVRRDEVRRLISQSMDEDGKLGGKDLASMEGKLQSLERNLLAYAEKLGLTPGGRVTLARRAAAQAENPDPMFGD